MGGIVDERGLGVSCGGGSVGRRTDVTCFRFLIGEVRREPSGGDRKFRGALREGCAAALGALPDGLRRSANIGWGCEWEGVW